MRQIMVMFKINCLPLAAAPVPPPAAAPPATPPRGSPAAQALSGLSTVASSTLRAKEALPSEEEALGLVMAAASESGAGEDDMRSLALSVDLRCV